MTKRAVRVDSLPAPGGKYSYGMVVDGLFYSAGIGPQRADGSVPSTIEEQTRLTLEKISSVLGAVGLGLADVVKTTVHLADLERDFKSFDTTYGEVMPEPYPVRTTVGSRLLGILIEIDVVAALPSGASR